MRDKFIWIGPLITIFLLVILQIWGIVRQYHYHSRIHTQNSRLNNIKLAMKDYINSPATNFASVLALLVVLPFMIIGAFVAAIFPLIVLQFLCILSGIIFIYYFLQSLILTIKSIRTEGLKTTIKSAKPGIISFFIFALFVLAYVSRMNLI